jgi:hypothetical protein
MTIVEGLTIFALIAGPIVAVLITRWFDQSRVIKDRQLDVFRALMRTRKAALSPDHVNALNLVEIDFYGSKPVPATYKELIRHFNNYANSPQWAERHRTLLTKLLSEMAAHLGYQIPQLEVFEGGYYPTGFAQMEEQQVAMRLGLIELLSGKRTLPVHTGREALTPEQTSSIFQPMADRLTKPT